MSSNVDISTALMESILDISVKHTLQSHPVMNQPIQPNFGRRFLLAAGGLGVSFVGAVALIEAGHLPTPARAAAASSGDRDGGFSVGGDLVLPSARRIPSPRPSSKRWRWRFRWHSCWSSRWARWSVRVFTSKASSGLAICGRSSSSPTPSACCWRGAAIDEEPRPGLRTEWGWSQSELADKLGVSRQTVNAVERERYEPSLSFAFAIAAVFGRSNRGDLSHPERRCRP